MREHDRELAMERALREAFGFVWVSADIIGDDLHVVAKWSHDPSSARVKVTIPHTDAEPTVEWALETFPQWVGGGE